MSQSNLAKISEPAERPTPIARILDKPLTIPQAAAIARAITNGRLFKWRVGYAFRPEAPFVAHETVNSLVTRGLLSRSRKGGRASVLPTVAAGAALAAFRASTRTKPAERADEPAPLRAWWIDP